MIKNINAGLQSIHTLIVHCRAEAYNCKNEKLAEDLDTAEYLLALIMQKTDETEWFEDFIKDKTIGENYKINCEKPAEEK